MSRTRRLAELVVFGLLGWVLFFGLLAAISVACPLVTDPPPKPVSNWTIEGARQFDEFPLYWMGETYRGLPLTSMRIRRPAYTHDHVSVTFTYGELELLGGSISGSWHAPLEIDIYHRCDNSPEEVVPRLSDEYSDDEEVSQMNVLGVDGYVVRYPDWDYLKTWSDRSAVFLQTWKTEFDIEEAGRDLVPITAGSGSIPQPLLPVAPADIC